MWEVSIQLPTNDTCPLPRKYNWTHDCSAVPAAPTDGTRETCLLLRASVPHWPQAHSTWQSPPISTAVLFLATPLGEAGEEEIEWGHRTVHNSGIGNWNPCTWLASSTNSVNLSHHFSPYFCSGFFFPGNNIVMIQTSKTRQFKVFFNGSLFFKFNI